MTRLSLRTLAVAAVLSLSTLVVPSGFAKTPSQMTPQQMGATGPTLPPPPWCGLTATPTVPLAR
jgi:hypothetical protein